MEIAIFVLGLIAVLGTFSIYKNGKKRAVVRAVIQDFMDTHNGLLVNVTKPSDSGPFNDEYFDNQSKNSFQSLGYQANETIYRQVSFQTADGANKIAWLQLRIENLTATYVDWKV